MTRSIFDPTGGEAERSGSRFTGADAENISHIPPDVVDGEVEEDEGEGQDQKPAEDEKGPEVGDE